MQGLLRFRIGLTVWRPRDICISCDSETEIADVVICSKARVDASVSLSILRIGFDSIRIERRITVEPCLLVEHFRVDASLCIKLGVRSVLDNVTVVKHGDLVRQVERQTDGA